MVSASPDLSLSARLFVGLQYCLPQHLLSRGVRWLTRSTLFKRPLIAAFMRGFKPLMHDALEPDPMAYKTFNAFFTRALRTSARSLPADVIAIACPVDGAISSCGPIDHDTLWQAKGQTYSLLALLAGDAEAAARYRDGSFLTIYLAPYNYHRIHMPINGTLTAAAYVPGALFSVNNTTAALVPGLFARNERVVCAFDGCGQPFSVILVGALFVGSMSTVWHGDIVPLSRRSVTTLEPTMDSKSLTQPRGAELGRFNMGSTVILLFPKKSVTLSPTLHAGQVVRMGEVIGQQLASERLA